MLTNVEIIKRVCRRISLREFFFGHSFAALSLACDAVSLCGISFLPYQECVEIRVVRKLDPVFDSDSVFHEGRSFHACRCMSVMISVEFSWCVSEVKFRQCRMISSVICIHKTRRISS